MHACGHDTHTAMLLATGKVLWAHRQEIAGTVRLLFQTSEEQSRGAEIMIENGAVKGADAVFGTHIGTLVDKTIPAGTFIIPSGCCMAAFDKFVIKVKGKGVHGSAPEKGIDPVNIAAHIVLALQAITTRELNATKPLVLTIGKIQGASTMSSQTRLSSRELSVLWKRKFASLLQNASVKSPRQLQLSSAAASIMK